MKIRIKNDKYKIIKEIKKYNFPAGGRKLALKFSQHWTLENSHAVFTIFRWLSSNSRCYAPVGKLSKLPSDSLYINNYDSWEFNKAFD